MTQVLAEPNLARTRSADISRTSARALARWPTVYLVEDNMARATRRRVEGLAAAPRDVVVRLHALTRRGIETVAEDRYKAGEHEHRAGRAAIALAMIDAVKPSRRSVVVAGAEYGDMRALLDGLTERALCTVVELRPSTRILIHNGHPAPSQLRLSDLLDSAWTSTTGFAEPVNAGDEGRTAPRGPVGGTSERLT